MTASGSNTLLALKRHTGDPPDEATLPGGNFNLVQGVRYSLGATQQFLANDLFGQGRDAQSRSKDVKESTGSATVPIDLVGIGYWLSMAMGSPTSDVGPTDFSHIYLSGEPYLRPFAIEEGHTDITPAMYFMAKAVKANRWTVRMEPRGQTTMDFDLIAQDVTQEDAAQSGTPAPLSVFDRFSQFENCIQYDPGGGYETLDKNVSATLTFDNQIEQVYYNCLEGAVGDTNPGSVQLEGEITLRLKDKTFFDYAKNSTAFPMRLVWFDRTTGASFAAATKGIGFTMNNVEIGSGAPTVEGASGVETTFQFIGYADAVNEALIVELKNQYAGTEY